MQTKGNLTTGATIDTVNRTFADAALQALSKQDLLTNASNAGGPFGFAFQFSNFAALLTFLET